MESGVGWRGGGERSTDNGLEVFSMAKECSTDRSLEVSRWRGVILFQSVFDDGAAMRRSLSVFDDGAVNRCTLVGFEWCALDGQESGVVPFGVEIIG